MTELLLVRHGQTDSNLHGRWQGWAAILSSKNRASRRYVHFPR